MKKPASKTTQSPEVKNVVIPAILPPKPLSDIVQKRKEWEKKYCYWLNRKNRFAEKLLSKGRTTEASPKYQELAAKVKEYWQLLHDTKPKYTPL